MHTENIKNILYGQVNEMVEYLKISGIDQMIPMDYVGFATVYDDHHVVINGGATIGRSMDEKQIQQQILMHFGDIQSVGTGGKYSDVIEEGTFNIIITLIRKHRNYSAYFILCKMDDPFTERDLHTAIFITNTANELLALNYTVLQEKRELQNLYDSIPTLITTLDTEGRIVSLNKAAEAIVGDRKQHIGHTMRNFLSEDKFQRFMPIYNEAIKTRKPIECMVKFHAINGKTVTNEMVIAPLISRKGEVTGVVFYGTDVTEKRVYEKEIEQLRQYALLGELSANIAHDIKNPLAGIHAVARLLQKGSSDNEDTVELLDDIINAVGRINNTVEQLLSYARLSSDHKENITNINQVLDNCIDAISFYHKFKQIQIHKKYDPDLPTFNARQIRIEQALINILLNSVQAIEESGNIYISTKYSSENKSITIVFVDDGIGFSKENKERVKEPFYTTKEDGTGLGLSIVNKVVEEHGGELHIDSTPGSGTVVTLTLYCS